MKKVEMILVLGSILFFGLTTLPAYADKSSVEIQAPEMAEVGTAITIKVNIEHNGNNFIHHTEWVYVKVNGDEVARWDFSWTSRPEGETFSREIEYTVRGSVEIEAGASCNLHGSAGKALHAVDAR